MNAKELSDKLRSNISGVIIGKDDVIEKVIISVLCGGHILLDDVPGTGKTTLAKALAKSIGCEFSRIQFTPDLLPSDLTGINYFNQKESDFTFRPGAVFTNILLADEINRATPRTQSSLLECMEERQVTVEGHTYRLDEPFVVIATQNPIEIQGTFPLPDAQLDRFFMRLSIGYPEAALEKEIMNCYMTESPLEATKTVVSSEEIIEAKKAVRKTKVSEAVKDYILQIVAATRNNDKIHLGVSTRGSLALMRAAQGRAAVSGRDYVMPDDVKSVAEDVLAHRIIIKGSSIYSKSLSAVDLINGILGSVSVPTEEKIAVKD